MKESSDGETLMAVGIWSGSSKGESTTSKIGFSPGNVKQRLSRGTQRTTRLMEKYEVVKVSRLLSGEDPYIAIFRICLPFQP